MDNQFDQYVDYIKQYLAQGYSEEKIRTVLSQANIDINTADKMFALARAKNKMAHHVNHSRNYMIVAKMSTAVAVIVIVFLVRTTGALQQNLSLSITGQNQPIVAQPTIGAETQDPATISDNTSATSSATPTPSASASPSAATTPAPTSSPIVTKTTSPTTSSAPPPPSSSTASPSPSPTPSPSPSPSPSPTYTYRNGTYSADGNFNTPGGTETIGITLVIYNDVVTSTSAVNKATNNTSINYTNNFISNYTSFVVGKKLSTLSLGKVSSASLTPKGFNAAASAIRSKAL